MNAPTNAQSRKEVKPQLVLRPFQRIGAAHLAAHDRAAITDTMGLGKTPQALTALQALPPEQRQRVIIVAPLATALGWQREAQRWTPQLPPIEILRRKDPIPDTAHGIWFIPWTDLSTKAAALPALTAGFDVVIADEAHRAKNHASAMSQAFTGRSVKRDGAWVRIPGFADRASRVWCLTGTPMPNGLPVELLPLLEAMHMVGKPGTMSKAAYRQRFCEQRNPFTPSGVDDKGRRNMDELSSLLAASGRILRRTPEQVAGELPDLQRDIVPIPMPLAAERSALSAELREILAKLGPGELPPFTEMAAYRRDLGKAKAEACTPWIAEWLEDNEREALVVFVHHKDVGRHLLAAFDPAPGAIFASGDDTPEERQAKVDAFAKPDGPRVFIGTIDACGTGMNGLHLRTSVCAFVECEWTPAQLDQAEGRIRRMGGKGSMALAYYLAAADCLDAHIIGLVADKRGYVARALGELEAAPAPALPSPAPALPSPAPARPDLLQDDLPEPAALAWTWTQDKRTGVWMIRAPVNLSGQDASAWVGAEVTITNRAGQTKIRRLVALVATGPHNGGWAVWSHDDPVSPGARSSEANKRFLARMRRRLDPSDALHATLDDGGPLLSDAQRTAVEAAAASARMLTACDNDRATVRNNEGWSQADVTVGRILASVDTAFWTKATLHAAARILRKYRSTQIGAPAWSAIEAGLG